MRRVAIVAVVAALVAPGLVALRVLLASRTAWMAGEAHAAEYDRHVSSPPEPGKEEAWRERRAALLRDATLDYREAATWYLPGSPYARRARSRLITIGQRAEQAGDAETALFAYRAVRTSILAARGVLVPAREDLDQADRAIARVSARAERPPDAAGEAEPYADRERRHLALLERVADPDPAWSLLAFAGLLAWIGGAAAFALRGLDGEGRIRAGAAIRCAVAVAVGIAAWIAGLALA